MDTSALKKAQVILSSVGALIGAALLPNVAQAAPAKAAASASIAYSAQATAIRIEGARNVGPIVISDTGSIATSGGFLSAYDSDVNIANGGLVVDQASAEASGCGPHATAEAHANGLHVLVLMWSGDITIDADYVAADVDASCNPAGKKLAVDSHFTIQNLRVNGQPITVTGAANQHVNLANDTRLIINEQTSSTSGGSADIQLVALHFWACDIEGRVCIVGGGLTSGGNPPPAADCGKVMGGGWIVGTPSGAKGTFGVSGGVRQGAYWGHLTYIDHGTGMKVESTAVTGFQTDPSNANGRIISYAVNINGVAGTAQVRVVDNGEPGRNDIFDITLSTGYHAAGDLGGAGPGGGNIQLHKCPPGWE